MEKWKGWVDCLPRSIGDLSVAPKGGWLASRSVLSVLQPAHSASAAKRPEEEHLPLELLEAETKRIAHALHDDTGQLLTLLGLKLAEALRQAPPGCATCLTDMAGIIDQLERQIREFSHELRPAMLDDYGLVPTLDYLVQGISERAGIEIKLRGAKLFEERPPSLIETVVYRTVQEALMNVSRHAHAKHVTIHFRRRKGTLYCTIRDDGVGFDVSAGCPGLGLIGMRQRIEMLGGRLIIESAPGHGTALKLSVPTERRGCFAF